MGNDNSCCLGCGENLPEHAIDPVQKIGDIVQIISEDVLIKFYQKKIQEILAPLKHKKKANKSEKYEKDNNFATSDKKEHQKYIKCLNKAMKENSTSTTNILTLILDELADAREKATAQKKFNEAEEYAALKCFVYLYTGNYTYIKLNDMLRKSEYQRISAVIGVVKKQLKQYNQEKFERTLKANTKHGRYIDLYRGVHAPDKKMTLGKRMYWRTFTSTSINKSIANSFGKFLYIIELDKKPHDYMIVPKQLGQFNEEQVIIFPFFYFECTQVEDFTSGAIYHIKQVPPENNEKVHS